MHRRGVFFPIFLVFIVLSGIIFFFAQRGALGGFTGFFESVSVPLQRFTFGIFQNNSQSEEDKLREENSRLLTLLAKQKELEKENKALHDQFETTKIKSTNLLPAAIIGGSDEKLLIDKGTNDSVRVGNVVMYKDSLIGQIIQTSEKQSVVSLITSKNTSFTAQAAKTESLGVIRGKGSNAIFFENVVLSDKLEKGDVVVTKGNIDEQGNGIPPDLIVGKIISVHKNPSALFQTAEIESLVNVSRLDTVFILEGN